MGQAGQILSKIQMDAEENFSPETIEKFHADPEFYREFVKKVEAEVNNSFPIVSGKLVDIDVSQKMANARSFRFSRRAPSRPLPEQRSRNI